MTEEYIIVVKGHIHKQLARPCIYLLPEIAARRYKLTLYNKINVCYAQLTSFPIPLRVNVFARALACTERPGGVRHS